MCAELASLRDETGFSLAQLSRLHSRFCKLDREGRGFLTRPDLLNIPQLAINPLSDRIVHAIFSDTTKHADQNKLEFQVWRKLRVSSDDNIKPNYCRISCASWRVFSPNTRKMIETN